MTEVRAVEADNHYYETLDTFTRHLDPDFKRRGVHAVRRERFDVVLRSLSTARDSRKESR